jgi:hypothetical protein
MTEAMDMDGRLDQLVRAGLMPTSSLPLLKRAISRMHAGMSLQGAERDVMNMFISSMMFIVLGDDTVFNKARAGAKGYATEEVELDENAPIVAHLTKRYGDNIRKSHVMSAAKDFGVDPSKLSKAVRKKLGKSMLDEAEDKEEYDYEGDMAMGQLKSIIANSQRMHDMLSDDTNLPEWVQSKITLAEDYISTASNYMQGEMNEEKMPFKGPYRKVGERKDKYGNPIKNVAKHLAKKAMNAQKNEETTVDKFLAGADKVKSDNKKMIKHLGLKRGETVKKGNVTTTKYTPEELQIDELSKKTLSSYVVKSLVPSSEKSVSNLASKGGYKLGKAHDDDYTAGEKEDAKSVKRSLGVLTAVRKLTKEEIEDLGEDGYVSKTPPTARTLKPEVKPTMNPAFKPKTSQSRVGTLARVRAGMAKRLNDGNVKEDIDAVKQMNESYKTAFESALNEYGIKSPSELDESKRKEFFNHVDLEFKKGDN